MEDDSRAKCITWSCVVSGWGRVSVEFMQCHHNTVKKKKKTLVGVYDLRQYTDMISPW